MIRAKVFLFPEFRSILTPHIIDTGKINTIKGNDNTNF